MKKKIALTSIAAITMMSGALMFSGIGFGAQAANLEVIASKLNFFAQGKEASTKDGLYTNGDVKVPEAFIYEGTTYVPIRKAAELTGQPVYWEGTTRSVSIGKPVVTLVNVEGKAIGTAILAPAADGVSIVLDVSELTPGKHGFHIHDKAIEGGDFKTAAGHFNPHGKKHGHHNPDGHHMGDLPNLEVGEDGKAHVETVIVGATLEPGGANSVLGRSIIIHAVEDDGKTDPAGNAGDRIAGGNIPQ
jgi:superoxide dismutase, Cu-Zn family